MTIRANIVGSGTRLNESTILRILAIKTSAHKKLHLPFERDETGGTMIRLNKILKADFLACLEYEVQTRDSVLAPVIEEFVYTTIQECRAI